MTGSPATYRTIAVACLAGCVSVTTLAQDSFRGMPVPQGQFPPQGTQGMAPGANPAVSGGQGAGGFSGGGSNAIQGGGGTGRGIPREERDSRRIGGSDSRRAVIAEKGETVADNACVEAPSICGWLWRDVHTGAAE